MYTRVFCKCTFFTFIVGNFTRYFVIYIGVNVFACGFAGELKVICKGGKYVITILFKTL